MLRYACFGRFLRALGALLGFFGWYIGGLLAASWGLLAPLGGLWAPSCLPLELHNSAGVAPSAQEASKEAPKPIPEPPNIPSKGCPKDYPTAIPISFSHCFRVGSEFSSLQFPDMPPKKKLQ